MNRRDVLATGIALVTLGGLNRSLAARPCAPTIAGAQAVACPPPVGALQWDWDVPSLQDETDFYTDVMGWAIPAGAAQFTRNGRGGYAWYSDNPPPQNELASAGMDIHYDTEADELWLWDQQFKRYGGSTAVNDSSTVADWRSAMLEDYKNNLVDELSGPDGRSSIDHMYGQGLAVIYNDTGDGSVLAELNRLRALVEGLSEYSTLDSGGSISVFHWGGRATARHAIVAAYAAQATNDPAWTAIRDNYIRAYETANDWEDGTDSGSALQPGTGTAYSSRSQMSYIRNSYWVGLGYASGPDAYDAGYRANSTFQVGLMAEAMWRLYVQSGSDILRDRLIKMARHAMYYAHDPSWDYPNVGSYFGHTPTGDRCWVSNRADGTATNASTDCSYDASLVNLMVIGYKLTGEQAMLDKARVFFARCNRWDAGGSRDLWAESNNHVLDYVDTRCNSSRRRFQWNKGIMQYCYMIFENGGNPGILT